jgi:hypothetical protein
MQCTCEVEPLNKQDRRTKQAMYSATAHHIPIRRNFHKVGGLMINCVLFFVSPNRNRASVVALHRG